jgi:hypothetical protein
MLIYDLKIVKKNLEYYFHVSRTGGAVCKVSYSLARATGRTWVQARAVVFAQLEN